MDKDNRPVVPPKPKMPKYDNSKAHSHVTTNDREYEALESPSEIALSKAGNGLIKITVVERHRAENAKYWVAYRKVVRQTGFSYGDEEKIEKLLKGTVDKYIYKNFYIETWINAKDIRLIAPSINDQETGRKAVIDELNQEAGLELENE